MMSKKRPKILFDIPLDLSDEEVMEELFEPFDPLRRADSREFPEAGHLQGAYDPIDWDYVYSLAHDVMEPIIDNYFRAEIIGADKVPEQGPVILATNHSGNALPFDAMVLDGLMWRDQGFKKATKFRSVYSPSLSQKWWMRPYGIPDWWRKCGGVDMKFDNYDYLLKHGHKVIYYPEGIPGIGKGFTRRYQLQHFYSSFVVLAARHNVPVYPVYSINAEWVNPTSITFKWLDKLAYKTLGIPFLPVPIIFLVLLFPFVFYLAFPCNMKFLVGDPIDVNKMIEDRGDDPQNPQKNTLTDVAAEIREVMQEKLNEAVDEYGQQPYKLKEWWQALRNMDGKIRHVIPTGWPFVFIKQYRDQHRPKAKNRLHAFMRDLDIWAYYIPLGWFLIALIQRLRKPPYGYRGLSKKERKQREGAFLWMLKENPLPQDMTGDERDESYS
ncbi:MAG: 1-acyl-sn-glycerol-3-phosphate acyltransferase [Bacteroidota bacterium]